MTKKNDLLNDIDFLSNYNRVVNRYKRKFDVGGKTKIQIGRMHVDDNGNAYFVDDNGRIAGSDAAFQLHTAFVDDPPKPLSYDSFLEHALNANALKFYDNIKARQRLIEVAKNVDYNTAALQEALYTKGYYDNNLGVKNIDGIWGVNSDAAYKKTLADNYNFDSNTHELVLSNEAAIKNHKVNNNINDRYVIVDKRNNLMKLMQGDKTIEQHEITIGRNRGDGYRPFDNETKYYGNLPSLTGSGVFTVKGRSRSPYLGHEPLFVLYNNGVNTSMAIHSPANMDRLSKLNNGTLTDNNVSFGCISPTVGVVKRLYNNKLLTDGDTVYVLPEMTGNYIYENKHGKLTTHYSKNNPKTYIDPSDGRTIHRLFYNRSE